MIFVDGAFNNSLCWHRVLKGNNKAKRHIPKLAHVTTYAVVENTIDIHVDCIRLLTVLSGNTRC